ARFVAEQLRGLGCADARVLTVTVEGDGGVEAAARRARYPALATMARSIDPAGVPVLLGHTADDQAETVLLGLGRGSGPRSIAGMRPADGRYLRPLLGLRRADTEAACAALGLPYWQDPHNADPRFQRARLRTEVLPLLEDVLQGGVTGALARTAEQLQDDLAALDQLADRALTAADLNGELLVETVADQPPAILARVLKRWAEAAGADPLSSVH